MKRISLILLALCIATLPGSADALVGVGNYVPSFLKAQADKQGGTTKFEFNPFISLDYVLKAPFGHFFNPEVGYVFRQDAEDESSIKTIFLMYNLERPLNSKLVVRYGFGTFMDKISGEGKTVVLQNGSGTLPFYSPSESVTSYTSSFNLGMKYLMTKQSSLRFDLNVLRFASSRRTLSYLVSYTFN